MHRALLSLWSVSFICFNGRFLTCRYSRSVRAKMTASSLRGSMNRVKWEKYPRIPDDLRKLTKLLLQDPSLAETTDQTESMYAGSVTATDGSHHVMFLSPRMAEFMSTCRIIQGDGTFRSRPARPKSSQCFVLVTTWRHFVSCLS